MPKPQEERDRETVEAAPDERAKFLVQYKLTQELVARKARAEERRGAEWG